MPKILSDVNNRALDELIANYNALPWYKKLFYPGALSAALNQYGEAPSEDSATTVHNACLKKTWFFQRLLFPSLVSFSSSSLGEALETLNEEGSPPMPPRLSPKKQENAAVLANPIAYQLHQGKIALSDTQQNTLKELRNTAHLALTAEDKYVLNKFYTITKTQETKLGELYKTLTFEQFIARLVCKRYDKAYLDGKQIFPRQHMDSTSDPLIKYFETKKNAKEGRKLTEDEEGRKLTEDEEGRKLLDLVGTEKDKFGIYTEYLSLAEMGVSAMVLMVISDVVLGRGARGNWMGREHEWYNDKIRTAFYTEQTKDSTTAAVFSYPAGLEFRNIRSASLDTVYCIITKTPSQEFADRAKSTRHNPALGETLHGLYGKKSALSFDNYEEATEDVRKHPENWHEFSISEQLYYLYKPAYQAKIERVLKQIILAHDNSMEQLNMGKVLNLKGLGLGAFGIRQCNEELEKLFVASLKKVHNELAAQLKYIKHINLINPPSLLKKSHGWHTELETLQLCNAGVQLTTNCMDPTTKYIVKSDHLGYGKLEYEVGGVVFCGDPATKPGNEARICHNYQLSSYRGERKRGHVGLQADSSDDPAQMYAMAQPVSYDPDANEMMLKQVLVLKTTPLNEYTVESIDGTDAPTMSKYPTSVEISSLKNSILSSYPKSYDRLYSRGLKQGANEKQKQLYAIRQILNDYTKNNSLFLRIIHGHWARHHVVEINGIVEKINPEKEDSMNAEQVLAQIKNIRKNPIGSLARRFSFIEEHNRRLKKDVKDGEQAGDKPKLG